MWRPLGRKLIRGWGYFAIILSTASSAIALHSTGALQGLELALLDQAFRYRPQELPDSRIVLVTLDETDITHLGHYPLTDGTLAHLIEQIKQHRPSVIGLNLYRNVPIDPGNAQLMRVFASTPNLIGVEKLSSQSGDQRVAPPPILRDRAQVAASDIVLDQDGKVRRHLVSLRIEDARRQRRTVLTLGARLALEYLASQSIYPKHQGAEIQLGKAKFLPMPAHAGGYVNVDVGGYQILANFRNHQKNLPKISFTQALSGQIPTQLLRDKIVLIGSVSDSIDNLFYTPLTSDVNDRWSGAALHAELASQIISEALDHRTSLQGVSQPLQWGWIIVWSSLGAVLSWRLRSRWSLVLGIPFAIGSAIGSAYLLFLGGWWMISTAPLIGFVSASVISRGHWIWKELNASHEALEAYAQTLELKVQERTQALLQQNLALQEAKRAADAANAAKGTFLANVNHELRTPLSIILSCSELLGYDRTLSEKQRSRLTTINHNVQHLLDLINDVLELSKLEADAVSLEAESVQLFGFLIMLEEMFKVSAIEKGIDLRFEYASRLPNTIEIDERKLRQVLINLLSNAIKFTDKGQVTLTVSASSCNLHFMVSDTGSGISEAELKTLFQPFAQTESGRRSHQGTGLGLAISQQFVQLMGGDIQVQSQIGKGTTFQFEVPIKIPQPLHSGISITNSAP